MIKIFVVQRIANVSDSLLLQLLEAKTETVGGLFQQINTKDFKDVVTFVQQPDEADYFMVPHNYFSIKKEKAYIQEIEALAMDHAKKVIVFAYGDSSEKVDIAQSIVLRTSQYKSQLRDNEIIVPAFVEDVGALYGIEQCTYDANRKPFVGFAGWAGFKNKKREIKYFLKLLLALFSGPKKQGIYFRRKVMHILQNATSVHAHFILRSSYSGHTNDIEDTPQKIRQEYIDVIQNADLALAVKGDGNYSLRFFEILSLGRIPLFIDTDCALPLENVIDYDSFMLRIDYKDVTHIEEKIDAFWQNMTNEKYLEMQMAARTVFDCSLRAGRFYRYLFNDFNAILSNIKK